MVDKAPPERRRALAANLLFLLAGAGVIGLAGEAWFRRSAPFVANRLPFRFVPEVGVLFEPHREVRWTNGSDFRTISKTNRLGFLDREPVVPRRAASSCHIALLGDSFVAGLEVAVREKVQVALEALAARERPELDITTSGFGVRGIGQVQQIPIYDAFVRPMRPKVMVLMASGNDWWDNSPVLGEIWNARRVRLYAKIERGADGRIGLRLPDESSPAVREWAREARRRRSGWRAWLRGNSFLWGRLERLRLVHVLEGRLRQQRNNWRRLSGQVASFADWRPPRLRWPPVRILLAPMYAETVELAAFALDEFTRRAVRDGLRLALFMIHRDPSLRLAAEERGIPVVDLDEYIRARGSGGGLAFPHDAHWSPKGHRWAAEALWKYLREHPSLCDRAETGGA